jgi:hypothetical protein
MRLSGIPKRISFVVFVLLISLPCFGQDYLQPNEEVILSFRTKNNKQMYLVKDKSNRYISYRFGTKDKIELKYPASGTNSWEKFKYSSYLRGGGITNEGMDLNYVYFTNGDFQYIIYQTYYAVGNKRKIGLKVINLKTNKTTDIEGNPKTATGTLVDFRDNQLLEIGDELFD